MNRYCYHASPDVPAHDLLNEATEWMHYAKCVTSLLSDLTHEADAIDCAKLSLGLDGISALMHMALQCTAQAHASLIREQARAASN